MGPDSKWRRREKFDDSYGLIGLAYVARSVKPKEVKTNEKAQAALDEEWNALRQIGAWGESKVREWSSVRDEVKKKVKRVHVGMVFGVCVETGSELPAGDPGRRYKGRVVFRGSDVRDESHFLPLPRALDLSLIHI